jgi:carboxypeptidase family protein
MKRALLIAFVACGCSLREPHTTAASCTSSGQCARSNVCFLGECRPPASGLSVVTAEVRPPGDSAFGMRQLPVDLRQSALNDFNLTPVVPLGGTVAQLQDGALPRPIPGALVTLTSRTSILADRVEQIVASADAAGTFKLRVPQGTWDVFVQPPAVLPPFRAPLLDTATAPVPFDISLPQPSALVASQGLLLAGGQPLPGASVTAIDAQGGPLSTPTVSQADGGFALSLPPGTSQYQLQVGPATAGADAGPGPSAPTPDPLPTYDPVQVQPATPLPLTVPLPLPPASTVSGIVLDSAGNPVVSAVVYARSTSTSTGWTLSRSVSTGADGTYALKLRDGAYALEAAPPPDPNVPAISIEKSVTVAGGAVVDFICPPKLRRFGQVVGPDGRPAGANIQIIATRRADRLVTTRNGFTLATDASGEYTLIVDAGVWRLEVVPPAGSALPRKIVQVVVDGTDPANAFLPTIQIFPPLHAVGSVCGGPCRADTLVAGATVNFYSLDSNGRSVLLGGALTDSSGRYEAVLPDVADVNAGP